MIKPGGLYQKIITFSRLCNKHENRIQQRKDNDFNYKLTKKYFSNDEFNIEKQNQKFNMNILANFNQFQIFLEMNLLLRLNINHILLNIIISQKKMIIKPQIDQFRDDKTIKTKKEIKYKIGNQIGSGTFGKVYDAVNLTTGERVAIKEAFQDKKYKNRQLQVISLTKNNNIIQMKDYYFIQKNQVLNGQRKGNYLYIVMDYYQTNLQSIFKQYRKEKRKMQMKEIKILAFQLFKSLYYLQKTKICHRDLKPPNILINPKTLELRICDFGSAKVFNTIQKNVTYICSRYYRAPELLFQYNMYGTEVDVWSAGCILVQFLTLQPLFPGDSTLEQLIQVIKVLGAPNIEYMKKYAIYYHQQLNLPQIPQSKWQKILKKHKPQDKIIDLISNILTYDLEKRLKPIQILCHPYFHDLVSAQYKNLVDRLPNLLKFDDLAGFDNQREIDQLLITYNRLKPTRQASIQKLLQNHSKLQTGDSTPIPQSQEINEKQYPMFRTKDSIGSTKSIKRHTSEVDINNQIITG